MATTLTCLLLSDTRRVVKTRPGLLVVHTVTEKALAIGETPYSNVLYNAYKDGIKFSLLDGKTGLRKMYEAKPEDFQDFQKVAPLYFAEGGFTLTERTLTPPLSTELKLDENTIIKLKRPT